MQLLVSWIIDHPDAVSEEEVKNTRSSSSFYGDFSEWTDILIMLLVAVESDDIP